MKSIKLPHGQWLYDPACPLGKAGGFGCVYLGESSHGKIVAVKQLHISAGDAAHRELRIAEDLFGRDLAHIIPVLDAGQDADSDRYYVVMARADKSLSEELKSRGFFPDNEAADVLLQIVKGLAEVPQIVHRDLKPANVLFHDGVWKLADFGIARFVEESTSLETLKGFLSAPYAAPEQWQLEHSTTATDIYALGCIAYELLSGNQPFSGPGFDDYKAQHLQSEPPSLTGHDARLSTLVSMMLRKAPGGRPSIERVISILKQPGAFGVPLADAPGFQCLSSASARIMTAEAEKEAKVRAARMEAEKRGNVANEAKIILRGVIEELFRRIQAAAPNAQVRPKPGGEMLIVIGQAYIQVGLPELFVMIPADAFALSHWDVLSMGTILVYQRSPEFGWGSSLWYAKLPSEKDYRWYEVGYMENPSKSHPHFIQDRSALRGPLPLADIKEADAAAAGSAGSYRFAFPPKRIDDEDAHSFYDRWAALLASAAQGELRQPKLPLD